MVSLVTSLQICFISRWGLSAVHYSYRPLCMKTKCISEDADVILQYIHLYGVLVDSLPLCLISDYYDERLKKTTVIQIRALIYF